MNRLVRHSDNGDFEVVQPEDEHLFYAIFNHGELLVSMIRKTEELCIKNLLSSKRYNTKTWEYYQSVGYSCRPVIVKEKM